MLRRPMARHAEIRPNSACGRNGCAHCGTSTDGLSELMTGQMRRSESWGSRGSSLANRSRDRVSLLRKRQLYVHLP